MSKMCFQQDFVTSAPAPSIVSEYSAFPRLQSRNWEPGNRSTLNNLLKYHSELPHDDTKVAVFDFDNTSLFGDVGKTVFRYQLDNLLFRLSPQGFANLFPDYSGTVGNRPYQVIKNRIISLYEALWPFISSNRRDIALVLSKYQEFYVLLPWYCEASRQEQELGPEYSLTFLARLLSGYTTDEVEYISCMAFMGALEEPIGKQRRIVHCKDPIGFLESCQATGLRVQPEIADLMKQLRLVGLDCSIVSASNEWVVKAAVTFFGLPVDEENVFGIRVRLNEREVLSQELPDNYPVTYRHGKVSVINTFLKKQPVLVAGDAVTDFEMLTMDQVSVRLLINHNKSGIISSLYNDPEILLQGIDKTTGSFRPHTETLER
ncbi:MAG: haloacid dehalogenase-like hydrolase [Desulfocapsa sp.]|jgi:phosphoserine phosphatase|nr:haloacid dehalogenase-like hydrolase [Desulfocapsa sp.]MBN4048671.1 haloacid dehalogenase-like hydrolase [bacterium AH-315-N22]